MPPAGFLRRALLSKIPRAAFREVYLTVYDGWLHDAVPDPALRTARV